MSVLKNMKNNYNQMIKLSNVLDSICDLQAVTQNENIIEQTNELYNTISKELEIINEEFKKDEQQLQYATYHKLVENKKVLFKISDRLLWFSGLELTNIKTNEKLIVKWDEFFINYIPLTEMV